MLRPLATATIAALVASSPYLASAQPVSASSGPDTYLQLRAGAAVPEADVKELDAGWEVGGRFGARFTRMLSIEGGVAYYRAEGKIGGAGARLSNLPIAADLRLRAPLKVAELSAFAGGGLQIVSISTRAGPLGSLTDTAAAFGYELGAAAAFNLSSMMKVGGEVRWTFIEPKFDTGRIKVDGLHVTLTFQQEF